MSGGYSTGSIWRQPRNLKSLVSPYYGPDEGCMYSENWRDHDTEMGIAGAVTTNHGTISLRLHNKVRVDMTIDRAVRIINFKVLHYKFLFL